MSKEIAAVMIALALLAGCQRSEEETTHHPQPAAREAPSEEQPVSEREQIESEVREGGLKDPGGAKSLRDEAADQQEEQKKQIDEVDQ